MKKARSLSLLNNFKLFEIRWNQTGWFLLINFVRRIQPSATSHSSEILLFREKCSESKVETERKIIEKITKQIFENGIIYFDRVWINWCPPLEMAELIRFQFSIFAFHSPRVQLTIAGLLEL